MILPRRRWWLVGPAALVLVLLAVGCGSQSVAPTAPPTAPPAPDWRTDPDEPYPFSGEIPPLVATALDGAYDRAPTENYPDRPGCTRCQPFPLDAGRSVLRLERGRYVLEQQQPRYRDAGHFVVEGDRIVFFNSPECGATRGNYRWSLTGTALTLTAITDECGFGQRARDLTDAVWQRLDS